MEAISELLKIEFNKAKKALEQAARICIISHRNPDGDAVGSNLALRLGLEALGKSVVSAAVDPPPQDSLFLKKADTYLQDFNYQDFDTFVSVDCGGVKMIVFQEKKPELLSKEKPFINFDHHFSNDNFGTINPVDANACSTAIIIYKFFKFCNWPITIDIANCMLHGIYFDTGGLMHSNTTAEVYRVAGELILKGADVKKISKELFHTIPVNKLRLWGRILERAYVNEEGVTISAVDRNDYAAVRGSSKDTGGAIDFLNAVPGSKYCILLSEDEKGQVRGSLRTQRDDVNLSEVAAKWGGGGHAKASGFGVKGELKPIVSWKILAKDEGANEGRELRF